MFSIRVFIIGLFLLFFIGCGENSSNGYKDYKNDELSTSLVELRVAPTATAYSSSRENNKDREEDGKNTTTTVNNFHSGVEEERDNGERVEVDNALLTDIVLPNRPVPIVNNSHNHDYSYPTSDNSFENEEEIIENARLSDNKCDQIIDKEFFKVCYDYGLKMAKGLSYLLEGDLVNELNIKERPSFYEEELIDEEYRAKSSDYRGSGYDRGHLAPDASFDWSIESLEATYSLANITPQVPIINRKVWVKIEQYARDKAIELGNIKVTNLIKFRSNPERIGENKIAVPIGYYKILFNSQENYQECFYYTNSSNSESLDDNISSHKVNCSNI
jgi:endonuclease G